MDHRQFKQKDIRSDPDNLKETARIARRELDRLLEAHPEFKGFQEEIDRRLSKAGSPRNRLAVLGIMIEGKLRDLQDHLTALARIKSKKK